MPATNSLQEKDFKAFLDLSQSDLAVLFCSSPSDFLLGLHRMAPEETPNCCQSKFKLGTQRYAASLKRGLGFSTSEKQTFKLLSKLFNLHYTSTDTTRTFDDITISKSITDLIVSYSIREESSPNWIASLHKILYIFKRLSTQRYEGSHTTSGAIVLHSNAAETVDKIKERFSYTDLSSHNKKVDSNFFQNRNTYRLVNGISSIFLLSSNLKVLGIIHIAPEQHGSTIDRIYLSVYQQIMRLGSDNNFSIIANNLGDVEVICRNEIRFVWRRGSWMMFDPIPIVEFSNIEDNERQILIKTIYSLSKTRHGAIILLKSNTDSNCDFVNNASGDSIDSIIESSLAGKKLSEVSRDRDIIGILATDGATIIDSDGTIQGLGKVIKIDTSIQETLSCGSRTMAAISASKCMRVIKISEDGPVQVYNKAPDPSVPNLKPIYSFG